MGLVTEDFEVCLEEPGSSVVGFDREAEDPTVFGAGILAGAGIVTWSVLNTPDGPVELSAAIFFGPRVDATVGSAESKARPGPPGLALGNDFRTMTGLWPGLWVLRRGLLGVRV